MKHRFFSRPTEPLRRTWTVNGTSREALVVLPAKPEGAPVIFAFHGHGGTMRFAVRKFQLDTLWPEAIIVYPQGLPTKTPNDAAGDKAGWMLFGGGLIPNRDLSFFEAMLSTLRKEFAIDEKRIYSMGHSNGAAFTYYLWGQRPTLFAALASVAGAGERLIRAAKPCPLLHIGSKKDPIVKWEQQAAVIEAAKRINGSQAPVEVSLHDQGHLYPDDASARIIAFFKAHSRP